jgi:hypothetical protein
MPLSITGDWIRDVQLLSKPYRRSELARRVREVLGHKADAPLPGSQTDDQ